MEIIVRNNNVQFSDLGVLIGNMLISDEISEVGFIYRATNEGLGYGVQPVKNWFLGFEERLIGWATDEPEGTWAGKLSADIPMPTISEHADVITFTYGGVEAFKLQRNLGKYFPDTYMVTDLISHELSSNNVRATSSAHAMMRDSLEHELNRYFSSVTVNRGYVAVTRDSTYRETLPVDTKTECLSIGEWAVLALNGEGGVSSRGVVMAMRETHDVIDRSTSVLCLEVMHAHRFDITKDYVQQMYEEQVGYPVELTELFSEHNIKRYRVDCDYQHINTDIYYPDFNEESLEALADNKPADNVITLRAMVPALMYRFRESLYTLMPLGLLDNDRAITGKVTVQVAGRPATATGWLDEYGVLMLDAGGTAALGVRPAQLAQNSVMFFNQVMFGAIISAYNWGAVVQTSGQSDGSTAVSHAMLDALDEHVLAVGGQRYRSRSRERFIDREDNRRSSGNRRDRGGRGR